jgi:hypothetical protein
MDDIKIKKQEEKQLIFFNEALEYFNDNMLIPRERAETMNHTSNILREEMLIELSNLKELLLNCPDIKYDALTEGQKQTFHKFISNYSKCPICNSFNHYYNLKNLFFGEDQDLLSDLLKLIKIKSRKFKYLNINFGIPCCNCFKQYFQEEE